MPIFKWIFGAAFVIAVVVSGIFSGLGHGPGLYFLLAGSIAAVLMGFSGREIAGAFGFAARRRGTAKELEKAAYFWEACARNAWILGVLGSTLNFTIALGRESGGIESISNRIVQALIVAFYGLVLAVLCLVPAAKVRGQLDLSRAAAFPRQSESEAMIFGEIPVAGRILGYVLFVAVLATAGYALTRGTAQNGPLSVGKILFHWPAILVVVGGTIVLAVFMGKGMGGRAWTLGFALTGLVSLLMGFIQALFGFVHRNIGEIASALSFIVSACSFALLGMLTVGAPLEDREIMGDRRENAGPLSRMFWVIFPLLAYIFLLLAFLMVITPMKQPG